MKTFKEKHTLNSRKAESNKVFKRYSNRVPIIVEKSKSCKTLPNIDRIKYLVPIDITIGQFMQIIRRKIKITSEIAMYIIINNTIPCTSSLISQIYDDHKHEDGFLYINYTGESVFGTI